MKSISAGGASLGKRLARLRWRKVPDPMQLRLLAEAERMAELGSWEWNLRTREVLCSTNLCVMLEIDPNRQNVSTKALRNLIHPQDRNRVRDIINGGLRDHREYEYQARFVLPSGRERILFTRAMPTSAPLSNRAKRIGFTQDVTERVKATQALRDSEDRYRDLVENSHDLICTHDLEGRLLWMNELPARILGYSADQLVGRRIPDLLTPDVRYLFQDYIERIKRDGFVKDTMKVKTRLGETRYWEYQNTLRTDGPGGPVIRGMAHDVTDRKRAQDALRRQEALVSSLFEMATSLSRSMDTQTILDSLILQAMKLMECSSACAGLRTDVGFSCNSLFVGETRHTAAITWPPGVGMPGRVLQDKEPHVTNDAENDPRILPLARRALGLKNVLCVPVFGTPGHEVIAFFSLHNKTPRFTEEDVKKAEAIARVASIPIQNSLAHSTVCKKEAELERLSERLMASQDDERKKIAHALHEQVAQTLSGLGVCLGNVKLHNSHDHSTESVKIIQDVALSIRKVSIELRELSSNLYPLVLELIGLPSAIRAFARTFSELNGVEVRFEIAENIGRLKPKVEMAIYRVAQEALTNIKLHSDSKRAAIKMARTEDEIALEVTDCGKGSLALLKNPELGPGLTEIEQRARQLGGTSSIDNRPGRGFSIRFRIPIEKESHPGEQRELPRIDL